MILSGGKTWKQRNLKFYPECNFASESYEKLEDEYDINIAQK